MAPSTWAYRGRGYRVPQGARLAVASAVRARARTAWAPMEGGAPTVAHVDRRNRNGTVRYLARYTDPSGAGAVQELHPA